MKPNKTGLLSILFILGMTVCGLALPSSDPKAREVENTVAQYFSHFYKKDFAALDALFSPQLEVVDYGERFNHSEWNWLLRFLVDIIPYPEISASDFNTRVYGDIAYTTFSMDLHYSSEPENDVKEVGSMVLRRIKEKWLIEHITFMEAETWHQWLRDNAKKRKIGKDWYGEYLKERGH